jgi:hypothetical protein
MSTASRAPEVVRPGATPAPEPPNGNGRKLSRMHLQKHLPQFGIVVNFFADTSEELWFLYKEMLSLIDDDLAAAYTRATRASAIPAAVAQKAKPAPKPSRGNGGTVNKPVCQECGSDESMELISWKDKATGELKKAWKCKSCEKWVR